MAKVCQYCRNDVEGDDPELEVHETNCAQNPNVQEKSRKLGEIEPFVKTVVLKKGKITRMYWAHSSGAEDFDIDLVLEAWRQINPKVNPHSVGFLKSRGFHVMMT